MKKFIAPAIVILIIAGFFGYIIYKDSQGGKTGTSANSPGTTTQKSKDAISPQDNSVTNSDNSQQTMTTNSPKKLQKPNMMIDQKKAYTAVLHTDQGDITIELNAGSTPVTVNNFVYLAKQHFYDNTIFHRVIKDFMIQGGDPTGTGAGGPGYSFDDEKFSGSYDRGTVAMANAGPNTNGSQFFIMHAKQNLPPNYVIFGKVTDGMDTVDKIATAPVEQSAQGEPSKPVTPVVIKSVDITEK